MIAVLDAGPGSVLSHMAAAALWFLAGFSLADIHVTRLRDGTTRRNRVRHLHYPVLLPPHHVTVYRGIPVTTPSRLMFDLAGHIHIAKMERTLERAWSTRLISGRSIYRVKADLGGRGRRGNAPMRELLATRPIDYQPAATGLELRVKQILEEAGFTEFERQINLGNDDEWLGRLDFYWRRRKLVIEVDSDLYHGALIDKAADAVRRAKLRAAGYVIVEVLEYDVWHRPYKVIADVREALRSR
jgi:very-short-patch-repair endonuclease